MQLRCVTVDRTPSSNYLGLVFGLNPKMRATFAAVVAIAQLLVVTHATLVAHTMSAAGFIVEQDSINANATHAHDATSWCNEGEQDDIAADAFCSVARSTQVTRPTVSSLVPEGAFGASSFLQQDLRSSHSQLSALVVSPKASPPHAG